MIREVDLENYTKWQNIYKEEFKPCLNSLVEIKDTMLDNFDYTCVNTVCNKYCELVDVSCKMLKWYLANNGLFQVNYLNVLKECFYVEMFEDGMSWINAFYLTKMFKENPKTPDLNKMIILMLSPEKLKIFYDLKEKLEVQL